MGNPAFSLTTGSTPTELTTIHIGSSDPTTALSRYRAGTVHQRFGITVASRVWLNAKMWTMNINSGSQAYMESLRYYFEVGSFLFYPDVDNTSHYDVFWDSDTFDPQYFAPDQYYLTFGIIETT